MILQEIIFPQKEICSEKEMYYRGNVDEQENRYIIKNGENVKFNTYFNSFSVEKWKKYTKLKNLILNFSVSGVGEIIIKNNFLGEKKLKEEKIKNISVNAENMQRIPINIDISGLKGIISFEIKGFKDFIIYEANYSTEIPDNQINKINIGICICTFKREEFVRRNVNILKDKILNNNNSQMKNNLDVFVVDNAQTLNVDEFAHENIHYIKNKNLGGAGGFTRGMIEAAFRCEKNITNCILMDDDIILDANVIERTYSFLSLLKEEYSQTMIGGAMLSEDKRHIQVAAGELWDGKKIITRKEKFDLRKEENVIANEIEEKINYNGWWYCCIPRNVINEKNLPLPIFIHMDDMEYGIRNNKGVIMLNGICVWHVYFENKGPITNTYYNTRNVMILNSKHQPYTKIHSKLNLLIHLVYYLAQYKYSEAELVLKGYNDFYLGIDNFKNIDAVELHKELLKYKYNLIESELKIDKEMKNKGILIQLFRCVRGIISYITPKFFDKKVYTSNIAVVSTAFAKKIAIFNIDNKKEYFLERDYKKLKKCLKEYRRIIKIINNSHKLINQEWNNRFDEITNLDFWSKYLELN